MSEDFSGLKAKANQIKQILTLAVNELENAPAEVLRSLEKAEEIAHEIGDWELQFSTLLYTGVALTNTGNYGKSIGKLYQAISLVNGKSDVAKEAIAFHSLGRAYYLVGQQEKGLEHIARAVKLAQTTNDPHLHVVALLTQATILNDTNKWKDAIEILQRLQESPRVIPMSTVDVDIQLKLGQAYSQGKSYDKAEQHLVAALDRSSDNTPRAVMMSIHNELATVYHATTRLDKAIHQLYLALEFSESSNEIRFRRETYDLLCQYLEEQGNFKEALKAHKRVFELYKETSSTEALQKISELEQVHHLENLRRDAELERAKNSELVTTTRAMHAAVSDRDRLLSVLAHDLRSPASGIKGLAVYLKDRGASLHKKELNLFMDDLISMSTRILDLLEKILEYRKVESGLSQARIIPIDLRKVLPPILRYLYPMAKVKSITIHEDYPTSPVLVLADETWMRQIVENLISNAIKFSHRNTSVVVRVRDEVDYGMLEVLDQGPGIPVKEEHKLFHKFQKLSNKPTNGEPTVGLGLSIVKALVDRLNGTVSYVPLIPTGSNFHVLLPKAKEQSE